MERKKKPLAFQWPLNMLKNSYTDSRTVVVELYPFHNNVHLTREEYQWHYEIICDHEMHIQ